MQGSDESRAIPMQMTQNSKHNKWLEMLAGKDFPPKLLWRTPTKIHRERKRQRQQKAAKQRDNRLAQRRQRRHTATTNMHRGSDKILQLHCNWSQWREGTPTADASKSDKEIKQRLHFYETYLLPPPLGIFVLHNRRPVRDAGINTWIKSVEIENKRVQKKSAREDKSSR